MSIEWWLSAGMNAMVFNCDLLAYISTQWSDQLRPQD